MIPEHYLASERFWTNETVEAAEDFVLPDYTPEVQRILGVAAGVTLDDTFLEGDYLETEGSILYTVLYQSSDKGLASVPLSSRFTCRIPVSRQEGDGFGVEDVSFQAEADTIVCRASSPRKLSLSSKVRLQCFSLGASDGGHHIDAASPADASTVICQSREVPVVEIHSVRQTASADGTIREREGTQVVSCIGNVCIQDVKPVPGNGEIRVTGEASVQLLLVSPDGSYIPVRDRCAVEEVLRMEVLRSFGSMKNGDGFAPEGTAAARCASVEVTCSDNGEIGWKMEYDIDCTVGMPGTRMITADGYSTAYKDSCTFRNTEAYSLVRCVNGRLTVTGEKQLRSGEMRFVYGFGRGSFGKAEIQNGRLIMTGTAILTGILCGEGEVIAEECSIPLRYECEAGDKEGECLCQCGITLFDISGRVEGDMLHMTAEAGFNGIFLQKRTETGLETITLRGMEPLPKSRPTITLYTPEEGDTDWTVQKRYRVQKEAVEKTGSRYLIRSGKV